LVGSLLWPLQNLNVAPQKALVRGVSVPEKTPSEGVSLVGGVSEPSNGLGIVLRHPSACDEHHREEDLSGGVSLVGQRAEESKGGCKVAPV
jgi:hypothetical protein